jgi:hypothetical protein
MNSYCTDRLSKIVLLVGTLMMGSAAHSHYQAESPKNTGLSHSSASSPRLLQPKSGMVQKDGRKPILRIIRTGQHVRYVRVYPRKVL